ncbi:alanine racemase [Mesorhizobium sp. M2D.F.Ca.ET.185.01.1.1]|uniref:alanine racemase n=3 Tax=Mesorhizobium TaxID=68287 RepID=UPI000FCB80E0|nr:MULTISPECIES: alanine racemase [unclassified Mesorhizobium]TGP83535.1 alanine racemase [bacterium M00.F.Ca.ET.227.01.1.1]TGP99490.1 alanine racemase [bacterium M00.F.Ca.ET.221.01.1.1]TGQ00219.1 alanine racemase [bacterium M00.F.Ca.ET.222.01.1.1]TGU11606.1 alanine racemase [bacterium M00.F.Ca.ET.163.01.1.1]TGU35205.1 alanine racemase [bacterium M00.F.Ca.ET.156.01.1.1]TGU51551.1 alanine racemase [bacterium M00.F.Ca.ET.146.01.1.1]TGV71621.1 alanine racemase [Mesorhizobium sp. M2D.F.Ca.ET.160
MNDDTGRGFPAKDVGSGSPVSEAAAGAILTIDLGAIRENYRRLKVRLKGVRCAGVLKADGYGLGAAQVASALAKEGCDIFFVALLGEGIALRKAIGPGPDIFVLNGLAPGSEPEAVAAGLCPVINSAVQLKAWRQAARGVGRSLPAAIQVDSGMARLGMAPAEVEAVAGETGAFDGIDIRFVMSHLARADEPLQPANEKQRREFERLRKMLPAAPASLANSSGIFLGPAYHYDLARPGAALYGVNPTPDQPNPMLPVIRLQAKVAQIREVGTGAGIGYGHAHQAGGPLSLATISLGYGDGWHRRAASAAWFEGARLPFVGRVSMDSIILDISALPAGRLGEGDLVELIGPSQSVDDAAGHAGTIGYEILTSLGARFHRRYVGA